MLAKFGVDTAENEPLKVLLIIQPWDLIFTEPHRPAVYATVGGWVDEDAISSCPISRGRGEAFLKKLALENEKHSLLHYHATCEL